MRNYLIASRRGRGMHAKSGHANVDAVKNHRKRQSLEVELHLASSQQVQSTWPEQFSDDGFSKWTVS
eukprot:4031762-Amphidinium_carterae.1